MQKKEQMYEGKAKKVFATDDPNPVSYTHLDVYKRQMLSSATAIDTPMSGTP